MAKYLRPRRGSQANAQGQKILLKKGEMFMEFPVSDIGKGPGRIVMGDGATSYNALNYATTATNVFRPFITDPEIYIPRFTNTTPASSGWTVNSGTAAIAKMGDGSSSSTVTLPTIVGAVKEALCKHADSITKLNNDLNNLNTYYKDSNEHFIGYNGNSKVYRKYIHFTNITVAVNTPILLTSTFFPTNAGKNASVCSKSEIVNGSLHLNSNCELSMIYIDGTVIYFRQSWSSSVAWEINLWIEYEYKN